MTRRPSAARLHMDRAGSIERGPDYWRLAGDNIHCGQGLLLEVVLTAEWDEVHGETITSTTWLPVRAELTGVSQMGQLPDDACVEGHRVLVLHIAAVGGRTRTRVVATRTMRLAWPQERR